MPKEPTVVYNAVRTFLERQGYQADKRQEGVIDGHHWMFALNQVDKSACAHNPVEDCAVLIVKNFLCAMEQIEGWDISTERADLKAKDYL